MMSGAKKMVPKRRFKEFLNAGDWEQRKFSEITYLSGIKNKENKPYESYSISNEFGFIPQNEQFEHGGTMKTADKSMYYIVTQNSFAYNPARINVGSIGYYDKPDNVIVSSLYEVFKTTEIVNDKFLWHWFKSNQFNHLIEKYQEGGVRLYFYYDKLCKGAIELPTIDEQNKISNLLNGLDLFIILHQRKLDKLQATKKALLQEMFPEEGQDKPKRRFKGFIDAWEQRKLSNLTQLITKGTTPKVKNIQNGINFIKVENISDDGVISINSYVSEEEHMNYLSRSILANNDILFSIAGTLGRTAIVKSHLLPANTNQALAIIRLNKSVDVEYINTFLKSNAIKTYIRKNPTVGAQPNLSLGQLSDLEINIPNNSEQKKISNLFSKIDLMITLHQRKLDKLKNLKQAYLNEMFV